MDGTREISNANRRTLRKLLLVVVGMFGFGYALVPLYNVFCDITGIRLTDGGRTEAAVAKASNVDPSRWVTVQFTGSVMEGLPWEFRPIDREVRIHPGELTLVRFYARNPTAQAVVGQAIPSVSPPRASRYFKKTECFCFNRQSFAAGEAKEMAVRFMVDPDLPPEVDTITLSYAFYETEATAKAPVESARRGG